MTCKGAAAGGEKYQTSHALRAEPPRFPDDLMKEWKSNQKCFFLIYFHAVSIFEILFVSSVMGIETRSSVHAK